MDSPTRNNPKWIRDEEILLVDLYRTFSGSLPDQNHPKVIELSELLTMMPWHPKSSRAATFRNPAGIAMKLRNLKSIETGFGKRNTASIDLEILYEFINRPAVLSDLAASIRTGIALAKSLQITEVEVLDEIEFSEGRLLTAIHRRRERSTLLRKELLRHRIREQRCFCGMCGASFEAVDSAHRYAAFEVHHRVPLNTDNLSRLTSIKDVALLCAVCHRLIHSLIAKERRWIDVPEAQVILKQR